MHAVLTSHARGALQVWLKEPARRGASALFPNVHGGRLSADSAQSLLAKHVRAASERCPSLASMGRAAAIAYAREGADVAINYFLTEEPDAREVIALIKNAGRKGIPIPGDLREEAFCKHLVDEAVAGLGGLDIVVCNAGRQQSRASILDLTTGDFDATMKTNIYAPFIKAALSHLAPQRRSGSPRAATAVGIRAVA